MVHQTIRQTGYGASIVEEYKDGTVFEICQHDGINRVQLKINGEVVRELTVAEIVDLLNY